MEDEFDGMRTFYVTVTFTMGVLARDYAEAEEAARTHVQEAFGADTEVDAEGVGEV